MNDELKLAILDTLKKAVELDLSYAEYDSDAMAEDFPDEEYPDPTLFLTDKGRNSAWPLGWLNTESCDGLYGSVEGFPRYKLRTVAHGSSMDDMVYAIQVEWSMWTLKLWQSEKGETDVTWDDIEKSAQYILDHTKFPG